MISQSVQTYRAGHFCFICKEIGMVNECQSNETIEVIWESQQTDSF